MCTSQLCVGCGGAFGRIQRRADAGLIDHCKPEHSFRCGLTWCCHLREGAAVRCAVPGRYSHPATRTPHRYVESGPGEREDRVHEAYRHHDASIGSADCTQAAGSSYNYAHAPRGEYPSEWAQPQGFHAIYHSCDLNSLHSDPKRPIAIAMEEVVPLPQRIHRGTVLFTYFAVNFDVCTAKRRRNVPTPSIHQRRRW